LSPNDRIIRLYTEYRYAVNFPEKRKDSDDVSRRFDRRRGPSCADPLSPPRIDGGLDFFGRAFRANGDTV
jgi:hypothetical protein